MLSPLASGYSLPLVVLSVAIAGLASYVALDLAGRINATQGRAQVGWWVSGATVMGIGIWAMHFVGMLAFRLPLAVHYDFWGVLVSIVPAIVASGIALRLVSRATLKGWQLGLGSLWMGLGIVSMHYLGMTAMEMTAMVHYDPRTVALSVLIAIGVSWVGLWLVFQLREEQTPHQFWKKLLAAIIMGAAIPTMHYTGMAAAQFVAMAHTAVYPRLQPPENSAPLAMAVSIGTLVILGLTLLMAYFDRRLSVQVIRAQTLQEQQRYLKTILQGIQVGVLVVEGEAAQLRLWNQAALDLLHLADEADLRQLWARSLRGLDPTASVRSEPSLELVFQQIAAQQPIHNAVVHVVDPVTQSDSALLVNAVPLGRPNRAETQMVCTLSEITDFKRAETQLKASEAQLRQQAQALEHTLQEVKRVQVQLVQSEKMSSLGQLVAGVAHEINNPVNFIHGNLGYLQDYGQDLLRLVQLYQQYCPNPHPEVQRVMEEMDLAFVQEDFAKILQSMQVGTDRIRQIVLSLRNFSRLDEADSKMVDIHEGLESTLMILHHRIKAKAGQPGIEVIRDYGVLPLVECYPSMLNQVFMNVLVNAIDAVEEARSLSGIDHCQGQITIRTATVNDLTIQITIADNGLGIPEAIRDRIFDPFFTTKPVGKGTGMGMSISYQIITEKHGGKLEYASTSNQGTEFMIQIPIQQSARCETGSSPSIFRAVA